MNLLAASAMFNNRELESRLNSAIRKIAADRLQWAAPAGTLAKAAYTAPETVSSGFMIRLSTDPGVVDEVCESCGHAGNVGDSDLERVVGTSWDEVALDTFGDLD